MIKAVAAFMVRLIVTARRISAVSCCSSLTLLVAVVNSPATQSQQLHSDAVFTPRLSLQLLMTSLTPASEAAVYQRSTNAIHRAIQVCYLARATS